MPERYLGKTLGKYRIDELVGSGGFAWVYKGWDPELDIPVALKVLKPQFAGDATFEERFRREASTAAKLRHPGIIKIYAVGRDGEAVYFVMDFLPSGLADKLETSPSLPEEFVVRMGIDVARALGFAHREGVIHRDIKVDNILFDSHGNAVVADFGIARAVSGYTNQTGTNMVVGTPQYFAPEQARAKPLDGRADIYSLGVSLYRSVTGRLPFEGDDWYEIARQHVEEPPPAPRKLNQAISPAFERLLLRCLAKHPDDRPATGEQLADELAAVLSNSADGTGARAAFRSPSDTPTLITPVSGAALVPRRPTNRLAGVLPYAAALLLGVGIVGVLVAREGSGSASTDGVLTPRTASATDSSGSLGPPATVDSARRDSTSATRDSTPLPPAGVVAVRRDSAVTPPRPLTGRLSVSAPDDANLFLNRVMVGEGGWRADTLKPGEYVVAAVVSAQSGCESARVEQRVRIRAGGAQSVSLQPRPCGALQFQARNASASTRYIITSDGGVRREGSFPVGASIMLPVGSYMVRVTQAQCAPYEQSDVKIEAEKTLKVTFVLLCGS